MMLGLLGGGNGQGQLGHLNFEALPPKTPLARYKWINQTTEL